MRAEPGQASLLWFLGEGKDEHRRQVEGWLIGVISTGAGAAAPSLLVWLW